MRSSNQFLFHLFYTTTEGNFKLWKIRHTEKQTSSFFSKTKFLINYFNALNLHHQHPHAVCNCLLFILYPIRSRTTYLSHTSRDSVEIQLRFIPPKLIFILLDSLACPKITITIYYMLHACCTLHETMHRICGSLEPLVNKRWRG